LQPAEIHALTTTQIQAYTAAAQAKGIAWAITENAENLKR
jgi:hypothetical protein